MGRKELNQTKTNKQTIFDLDGVDKNGMLFVKYNFIAFWFARRHLFCIFIWISPWDFSIYCIGEQNLTFHVSHLPAQQMVHMKY